jgi:DNA polymerase-3 subunit epsilon
MASHQHIGTCFPTGRHYPGIASRIAAAIQDVEGLADEYDAGRAWTDLPLVVIDFETTGTDATTDRVIEIGMVGFDQGKVTFCEGLLMDPGMPIPEESRAIHGISDEEVAGAPSFAEALPRIVELMQGRVPVAYNAGFDRGFLLAELERVQGVVTEGPLPPAFRQDVVWVDPLVWARETLDKLKRKRLVDVAEHFGVPLEQAHRAAGDAEATGHVLMKLAPKMPEPYGELVRLQVRYAARQEAEFARFRSMRRR